MSTPPIRAAGAATPPITAYLLVVVAVLSGLVTLLTPHLLTGPPAMNGSAKGTALVVVVGGAPLLAMAYHRARQGSLVALTLAAGAAAYLVYNAVMLVFATPFNRAFLLYDAMLGLGIWTLVFLVRDVWVRSVALTPPASRGAGGFVLGVVVMNLAVWLSGLVPALMADDPRSVLDGTGLTTNPVYVQDLAFWLPAFAWIAIGMWRAHGPRTALGASALCYWVLEAASVAVDQWWGNHADPSSAVVSASVVPVFVVLGVVTSWVLLSVLRTLSTTAHRQDRPARSPHVVSG